MRGKLCDSCFKPSESLKKCSGCRIVYYCDQDCQKIDWRACHKHGECDAYKKALVLNKEDFLTNDTALLLLRVYLTFEARKDLLVKPYKLPDGSARYFMNLMSHPEDMTKVEDRMKCFDMIYHKLAPMIPALDRTLLFVYFSKICINSFSVLDNSLNEIGSAIYIEASIFNHSCQPNATTVWDGLKLEIRAIKPIPAGQEICTNYIDIKKPRTERQEQLKNLYYFDCKCQRCESGEEGGILWTQVNTLNERMDDIIFDETLSKDKFRDVYILGIQTLPLYEKVYGEYHPDMTIQLMRIMKARANFDHTDDSAAFIGNKLRSALEVTHGKHHSLYKMFEEQFL